MAALNANLQTETRSEQRYIQPAAPAPSFLENLANFGSNLVGVASDALSSVQQGRANKNALADQAAKNDAASQFLNYYSPTSVANTTTGDPGHDAAVGAAKSAAPAALNAQTAVSQGTMDPGAAQARSFAITRQLLAAHPGHEAAVVSTLHELGVTNLITQQYQNAEGANESAEKAKQDRTDSLAKLAVTKYGYSNYDSMNPEDQALTLANVSLQEEKETELDQQVKRVGLLTSQQDLTDKQTTALKTQLSTVTAQKVNDLMGTAFTNLNKVMFNTVSDPALQNDPARLEKLQGQLLGTALPALDQYWATKMGPVLLTMSDADRTAVTNQFNSYKSSLKEMLSGPSSVFEQNQRIMQDLSNKFGIDYSKSAPTLMRLQKLLGPSGLAALVDPSFVKDPKLQQMLSDEMKGLVNSGDPTKAVSFTALMQTITGDVDMKSLSPDKIAAMAPAQMSAVVNLAANPEASNGTDPLAHKALVKAIGNTSAISAAANVGWGFNNLLKQGQMMTSPGVVRALFMTSQNGIDREDAAHDYVHGLTATYEALAHSDAQDKYYSLKLDPHTLTWQPVWNGTRVQPNGADFSMMPKGQQIKLGINPNGTVQPHASSAVLQQAATLNHMLHRLSDAAKNGYDTTFGKGLSYNEARKYYATGEIPNAGNTSSNTKSKNGKTPEQNIQEAVSHVLDFANNLQYEPAASAGPAPTVKGALAPVVAAAASKYGVPPEIASRLIGRESSGNTNVGDSDKGAAGLGQIMPKTAAAYGVSDVHSLSPEQQLDLSMHILADNYKRTGNWHDAVSMYHSGRTLAYAAKHNLTDGHMRTVDYVASIAGLPAMADIDMSGAMPIGVPTPWGTRY